MARNMQKLKLYGNVKLIEDKDFICPKERVIKGTVGKIVDICKKGDKMGYIVEINDNVYDFFEDEIELIN